MSDRDISECETAEEFVSLITMLAESDDSAWFSEHAERVEDQHVRDQIAITGSTHEA